MTRMLDFNWPMLRQQQWILYNERERKNIFSSERWMFRPKTLFLLYDAVEPLALLFLSSSLASDRFTCCAQKQLCLPFLCVAAHLCIGAMTRMRSVGRPRVGISRLNICLIIQTFRDGSSSRSISHITQKYLRCNQRHNWRNQPQSSLPLRREENVRKETRAIAQIAQLFLY